MVRPTVQTSRFGRRCAWAAYLLLAVGLAGLLFLGWSFLVTLGVILVPAVLLWLIGLCHDYRKTLRGELYWQRYPGLHRDLSGASRTQAVENPTGAVTRSEVNTTLAHPGTQRTEAYYRQQYPGLYRDLSGASGTRAVEAPAGVAARSEIDAMLADPGVQWSEVHHRLNPSGSAGIREMLDALRDRGYQFNAHLAVKVLAAAHDALVATRSRGVGLGGRRSAGGVQVADVIREAMRQTVAADPWGR